MVISGSSVVVEDVPRIIGTDFNWTRLAGRDEQVEEITITGFMPGSFVKWSDGNLTVQDTGDKLTLTANSEEGLIAILETLTLTAPLHSDSDFSLSVTVMTRDDPLNNIGSYTHRV